MLNYGMPPHIAPNRLSSSSWRKKSYLSRVASCVFRKLFETAYVMVLASAQ